jgi:hypothetical protein
MSDRFDWSKADLPDIVGALWRKGPSINETTYAIHDTAGMKTAYFGPGVVIDRTLPKARKRLRGMQERQFQLLLSILSPQERDELLKKARKARQKRKRGERRKRRRTAFASVS